MSSSTDRLDQIRRRIEEVESHHSRLKYFLLLFDFYKFIVLFGESKHRIYDGWAASICIYIYEYLSLNRLKNKMKHVLNNCQGLEMAVPM